MNDKLTRNGQSKKEDLLRLALSLLIVSAVALRSEAAQRDNSSDVIPKESKKSSKSTALEKTMGLDRLTFKLVNQGRFKDVADRLKLRGADISKREAAWLAFSYMYINQCDDLDALAKSVSGDDINAILVQVFDSICHKKLDEADKKLQSIPAAAMKDPFINFSFAALAGKQKKPEVAITYTERAITLAPEFAWGYRTMAFLEQRSLNAPADAEAAYERAVLLEPDLTDAVNALVDLKLVRNDFDGAIEIAQGAIKNAPRDASNYFRLAQIYIQQWRLKEASKELERAIAIDSSNAKYYRTRSSISRYQGKLNEAIADLGKALDLSSDKKFELTELASLEMAAGKEDDATQHLLEAVALDAGNQRANSQLVALLTRRGKFDQLVTVLQGLVSKNPKNADLRNYYADALVGCKRTSEAAEQYKEAANLNQSDPEPHRKLAVLAVSEKNFRQAEKEYTRALNINPNSTPDLVALGYCYAQTDDYLQAEAGYVTALALHQLTQPSDSKIPPTRLDIMRSLATLLFKEGRYADAAAQFATICAMDKGLPEEGLDDLMLAQSNALRDLTGASFKALKEAFDKLAEANKASQRLAYIDTLLRGQRFDEAIAQLQLSEAKDSPLTLVCWSRAWRGKNDIVRAEEAVKKAIEISEKSGSPLSDTLVELGEVNLAKGNLEAAQKNAHQALAVNEKAFRALSLLGMISLKQGQANAALMDANRALEINPYFTEAYLVLGNAQLALNDLKGASSSYEKAAKLYPGLREPHEALVKVLNQLSLKDEAQKEEAIVIQIKAQQ